MNQYVVRFKVSNNSKLYKYAVIEAEDKTGAELKAFGLLERYDYNFYDNVEIHEINEI